MTDTKKKIRSKNWLEEDKRLLQELVKERVHTIENKNTDSNTNQQKKKCWNGLLDSFNSLCTGKMRSVAQLKTQWGSLKLIEKKKIACERRELIKTGGGPQEPIAITCHNDIRAWLSYEFVVDVNEFDSDTININKIVEKETSEAAYASPESNKLSSLNNEVMMADVDEELEAVTERNETEGVRRKLLFDNSCSTNKRKKRKISTTTDITTKEILAISSTQVECRKSLHAIQMEVENLRKENNIKKKHILEVEEENAIIKKHILELEEENSI